MNSICIIHKFKFLQEKKAVCVIDSRIPSLLLRRVNPQETSCSNANFCLAVISPSLLEEVPVFNVERRRRFVEELRHDGLLSFHADSRPSGSGIRSWDVEADNQIDVLQRS
jgi:hypothetical protein